MRAQILKTCQVAGSHEPSVRLEKDWVLDVVSINSNFITLKYPDNSKVFVPSRYIKLSK